MRRGHLQTPPRARSRRHPAWELLAAGLRCRTRHPATTCFTVRDRPRAFHRPCKAKCYPVARAERRGWTGLYRRRECGQGAGMACSKRSHRGGTSGHREPLGGPGLSQRGRGRCGLSGTRARGGPASGAALTGRPVETSTGHVFHWRKKEKSGLRFSRK